MKIVAVYSFNNGEREVKKRYPKLFDEVMAIIDSVDSIRHLKKISKEKTMSGQALYAPISLNKSFKKGFYKKNWKTVRVPCNYSTKHYVDNYNPPRTTKGAFREMDFIKEKLGVEVQFGKYAFMVYNVCAKMTIFNNLGHIDTGIEIVPVKKFAQKMSTGVSYFEQFAWDLDQRGISDIDIPVLILGIDK